MMNHEGKRPVQVEDLLRLKQAERPTREFWNEFDRELRAKQLAALVAKRPWWRSLPESFRGLTRYHLPLGATAVLAITLISIHRYHPGAAISPAVTPAGVEVAQPVVADAGADEGANAAIAPAAPSPVVASTAATPAPLRSDANAPGELSRMVPLLSAGGIESPAEIRPSARSIAENLAVAEAMLGTTPSSFEARAIPARQAPREPLAEIATPAESRHSRFAAAFASMSTDPSIAPSARVARRLSDEQLYDSIHRFGASGNSVSFKF